MVTALLATLALASVSGPPDEITHAMQAWIRGRPVSVQANDAPKPMEVWGLDQPLFKDATTVPTRENPLQIKVAVEFDSAIESLVMHPPFRLEILVYRLAGNKKQIARVVKMEGAVIVSRYRVMPGHGREGGLANRPYLLLNLACKSLEAGPPDKVKPTIGN